MYRQDISGEAFETSINCSHVVLSRHLHEEGRKRNSVKWIRKGNGWLHSIFSQRDILVLENKDCLLAFKLSIICAMEADFQL